MKLLCKVGWHKWDVKDLKDMQHRPCYRYHTCQRCGLEERIPGWHRFSEWGETYYVDVVIEYGFEVGNYTESRQDRYCTDCKLKDRRVLK